MTIDDHLIENLRRYFKTAYEELKKEWKSEAYGRISDCPSFKSAYTYREAMDILIKGPNYIDYDKTERLKKEIDEELELENFWKQNK
jgi:hypothetical protein